ncbi:MAG: hypothetical protein ACP5OC_08025 [Thermoplasmata archaeon]
MDFTTTTDCSAPVNGIGDPFLAVLLLGFAPLHPCTGSQVLVQSLCRVDASSMPVTAWTVSR